MDPELLRRMSIALEHRGPDSRGAFLDNGIGLGIQRLRVIDLASGDQPIFNEDRTIAVVLNGEIYNYRELRQRLQLSGHTFRTRSDTEVIVHLYEEEGLDCVHSLHGMFAFALWDGRRRQLLLARDRVGKKPLFYSQRDGSLSFASELRALMRDAEIPRDIDHQAMDCFMAYGYIPAPHSAFRAVRKLPPASTLVARDGRVTIDRYWSLDYSAEPPSRDLTELHQEIRSSIRRAVRRRMVADVPVGAFLSGGIDSSAVVAAMAEVSPQPVKTFSIGFKSDAYNELDHARAVAQQFSTDHHELVVEPNAMEILPRVVRQYGEPFGDSSAIPTFYVAELASSHVTVALNGDGGDESFAGYPRYASNLLLNRFQLLPAPLRQTLGRLGGLLPDSGTLNSTISRARRVTDTIAMDPASRYVHYLAGLDHRRDDLYTQEYRELVGESLVDEVVMKPWRESTAGNLLDLMLDVDVRSYLPDDLLAKVDIATMAYSLEARSPLLDHEFMQLAASLSPTMKVKGLQRKVGLRDALRGMLPDELLDRPKRGFEVPLVEWFRADLREFVRDVLLDPSARGRGYFRPDAVRSLVARHQDASADESRTIWSLLVFELWHREFVDDAGHG